MFDEPSANLDENGIFLLKQTLNRFKSNGKTIIVAVYTKADFLSLSKEERKKMGLRTTE